MFGYGVSSLMIRRLGGGGVTQQYAAFTTSDTTIAHRFDSTPATQIRFVGANGAEFLTTNNNVTTDVGAQGLTTPIAVVVPMTAQNSTIISFPNNGFAGAIPALPAGLTQFDASNNQLTGSIPALPAGLTSFNASTNQLTGYSGTSLSNALGEIRLNTNALPQTSIDAILAQLVAANRTTGTRICDLGGVGNAAPSATGITNRNTLVSRGWTVTTN